MVEYYEDLLKFLKDLRNNFYMQYTIEDVMLNVDGKQVIADICYSLSLASISYQLLPIVNV